MPPEQTNTTKPQEPDNVQQADTVNDGSAPGPQSDVLIPTDTASVPTEPTQAPPPTPAIPAAQPSTGLAERERRERIDQQLREKRMQIDTKTHMLQEVEGKISLADAALKRANESVERLTMELQNLEKSFKKKEGELKHGGEEMRQKDAELHRLRDEEEKLEKEIKTEQEACEAKKAKIAQLSEERRTFTHKRDGMRRTFELGRSGAKTDAMHLHDKRLDVSRLEGEMRRSELAIAGKKRDRDRLKSAGKDVHTFEMDIARLELAERHTKELLEKTKREIAETERNITREEKDSHDAEKEMHQIENELHRISGESLKMDKEIGLAMTAIEGRQTKIRELKQHMQEYARDKEQGRRAFELGHFTSQEEFTEISEKRLDLVRYQDEARRKSDTLLVLKSEAHRLERMIFDLKQEIELISSGFGT